MNSNTGKALKLVTLIKQLFIKHNKRFKTVKQLDKALSESSRNQEAHTRFRTFLEKHELSVFYQKANDEQYEPFKESELDTIEAKLERLSDKKSQNNLILDQVLAIYKKYIKEFSAGNKVVFKQPWLSNSVSGIPRNANTGKHYKGGNCYLLSLLQDDRALDLPFFLNRGDINELGLEDKTPDFPLAFCSKLVDMYVAKNDSVKARNKWLTTIQFEQLAEQEQENYKSVKTVKYFPLYHHSQFESNLQNHAIYQQWIKQYPETELLEQLKSATSDDEKERVFDPRVEAAKNYLHETARVLQIDITDHNSQCYYSPSDDSISMVPEDQFSGDHSQLAYVGVLAHELSHATGHPKRLNRKLTGLFGAKNYAFEELIAESSSLQIMKQFNLPSVLDEQSAAYIYSWLQRMDENSSKDFLSIACQKGQQASDFVLTKSPIEHDFRTIEQCDLNVENGLEPPANQSRNAQKLRELRKKLSI